MKNELFNIAKNIKDQYNKLYEYRNKLYHAKSRSLPKVRLEPQTSSPFYFENTDLIREAVEKEIELVTIELDALQKVFDEL
jgi:hypothetical protein